MLHNLSENHSIASKFVAELRDASVQTDRMRFRRNLERIGEIAAYEISKTFRYFSREVETPMGIATCWFPQDRIVLGTILRAGLPLHQGLLNFFDEADNAFIGSYRRHHKDGTFDIQMEYTSCPDINGAILIVCDPMLATGASMELAIKALLENGKPRKIHVVTAIATNNAMSHVRRMHPSVQFWAGDVDDELTAKSYIVPGLGDAGDLAFGSKI